MIDFAFLMDYAFENRLYESKAHGVSHWKQVEFNGIMLAQLTGADMDVVRLFSIFHDCKRYDDFYDENHGLRGGDFAKECRQQKFFKLDDIRFEKLYNACKLHTHTQFTDDITINTCFDADRLDLGRVGFPLDPVKMATREGRKLAQLSLESGYSVYDMRNWIRALDLSNIKF